MTHGPVKCGEFVRRQAMDMMGDVGRPEFVETLVRAVLRDPSTRVAFRAREALRKYPAEATRETLEREAAAEASFHDEEGWTGRFVSSCSPSSWSFCFMCSI